MFSVYGKCQSSLSANYLRICIFSDSWNLSIHIGGIHNLVPATLLANGRIKEKIRYVIQKVIIESNGSAGGVLIQFWAPRTVGDRCVLTTADQPFGLSLIDGGLCEFRRISMKYKFYVDAKSADDPAVLGHVFRQTVVACTPDVKYYSSEEYPQRCDAVNSHVQTSLAFPVIEPSSRCCVGVLELLATASIYSSHHLAARLQYEIQDLGLKYSDAYGHAFTPVDQLLEEISNGVKAMCETHKLPLVQTWVPCRCCISVDSCSRCYTSCKGQVMTNLCHMKAPYAFDEATSGFPFSMNYLLKGQGVAGRALSSYSPCFCRDVTRFSFTEYPLVHLARIFGLTSCFAICLRSTYTGDADYVIEFFLPLNSDDGCDPRPLLDSILATMKQHFQSFKVASGEELGQGLSVEVIKFSQDKSGGSFQICQTSRSTPRLALLNVEGMVQLDSSNQQLVAEAIAMNNGRNAIGQEQSNGDVIYSEKNGSVTTSERENKKTEISIRYEDLEPHFGKNLNDVAESLGISRSTLKRICRNHGITRWSCRKRMKRNGGTDICVAHGGGKRCVFPGCTKGAHGRTVLCVGHGGGKRCVSQGCTKSAHGRTDCCVTHGGGKHCRFKNCGKSAQGSTDFCKAHGGGKQCNWGEERCEKFARGKSGLCAAHSSMAQERQTNKGGKQVNESVQRAEEAASLTFAFPVLGALASAETEEPLGEKPIEDKGTLHYLRNLCPTTAEAECHQGLEFEPHEVATGMALALVPDAEISARSPKASIGVAFTQSSGNSHGFRNLFPSAVKACQQDSEQEFQLAIASLPANSLSAHVSSQPETPSGGMLVQNVVSSKHTEKCSLATTRDACLNEEIACKEAYTKSRDTAMQDVDTVTVKARYGNDITIKFRLSLSSGLVELQQEVAKRLKIEGETYYIKYKDEEEELILIACNEDLKECIETSRSLGKTSIVVLLEPK